jgi:hypothetical protein
VLSPLDDFPIHQIAEPMRRVGTSDRNFYDRYYFNLHGCSDELFLVAGMGQYPNLCVQDAFLLVVKGKVHRVLRASRELGADRMDLSVGPIRIEVLEGLKRLRLVAEENPHGIRAELEWNGAVPAHLEPPHRLRQFERITFDTQRLWQTGRWSGWLELEGERIAITPDRWWGTRDRSWGVRPVGEAEPPGVRVTDPSPGMFWSYAPMQFDDHSIMVICQETPAGQRVLEEAVRVWADPARQAEPLGRPELDLELVRGTREVRRATIHLREPGGGPLDVQVEPLLKCHVTAGTGYGFDADWRHGMYQGRLVVQGLRLDYASPADQPRLAGFIDAVARFRAKDRVGYGLFEYFIFGPSRRFGFASFDAVAR